MPLRCRDRCSRHYKRTHFPLIPFRIAATIPLIYIVLSAIPTLSVVVVASSSWLWVTAIAESAN